VSAVAGLPATFRFRLYIVGGAQNSAQALANLSQLCRRYLVDRHDIEVIDVFLEPQRALVDRIFMTPTLIRVTPEPAVRIVGTLSKSDTVLRALGLDDLPS
jgi:circadian clock protein KaiB